MINPLIAKISMYLKIGLLIVIIACLVFIGIQYVRIKSLENDNDNLEIKNEVLTKDKTFLEERIKILSDFTNSNEAIEQITNIINFDSDKQIAIDKVIEDFYKE